MARNILKVKLEDDKNSFLRTRIEQGGPIHLEDLNIETYKSRKGFRTNILDLSGNYQKKAVELSKKYNRLSAIKGFEKVESGLLDAILNAHQHGNKFNLEKKIKLSYKIDDEKARFAVIDEGGILEPEFYTFLMRHHQGDHVTNGFINHYNWSGKEKKEPNLGAGTFIIHTYFDKVKYFKSKNNGLVIHMSKKKENI